MVCSSYDSALTWSSNQVISFAKENTTILRIKRGDLVTPASWLQRCEPDRGSRHRSHGGSGRRTGNCEGERASRETWEEPKDERCVYRRLKCRRWRKRYPLIGLYPNRGSHRHLHPWLWFFNALIDIKILNKMIYDIFFFSKNTLIWS